jgi:hypothetical protein
VHGGNASSFAREFYSFLKKRGLVRKFKIEIAGFLNLASLSGKKDAAFIVSPLFDPACSTAFISQKEMAAKIRTFFPKAGKITLGFKNNNTEFDTERAFEDILQRAGFGG